ncbi:adenylyl cyclase-associated protein 2 [Triplophysa rosa]|uniref:Adenylyl cyclase-associated protein n=1 Tax=Triplophysa rosa TaxID=992332 RepID=A0A9W7TKE4_TRIRA|nr:adenylyl cyclase-associated protein 2 [Triplophysa rosa]XP_057211365.1 adenylyl cyclase-associated protein 2 [Triplophysa rosa]XP_057211366.1 adenylyl cyclase-associated protein 2 [Triplophysa rosa]XP_057211367.1 adenylyl cyclase-associated protein 2 [Triplophysa rosa]XP_057211369.1 adenylyl cyclase-associated protein 2 [Triplophysa rosa]XP_057211370.1 adenylyl cyclase-associated protein 2 [Triplophysa rosa]KAI7798845.1 putative adenylyl cyclase-associated protein 2 [Triplophysa rosa]
MEALVERLERAVIRLEVVAAKLQNCPGGLVNGDISNIINGGEIQSMEAFNHLLSGPVSDYMNCSTSIGGDVAKHAEMVNNALQVQRTFLKIATTHREPAKTELNDLLRPLSEQIQEVQSFREKNRGSSLFNHLSAVSESIPALGWVAVCQKPGPYVKEMNDAAMFYTNRVLKDFKDTDPRHVEWVRSYLSIWTELQIFIKEHHTTGLVWNKTGPVAPTSLFSSSSDGPCPPPPPPPPGPPPVFLDDISKPDTTTAQHSALFAQLNQGAAITKGLKHVSDEQKTQKKPALRTQDKKHQTSPSNSQSYSSSAHAPAKKHSPVLELEGKKWRVEYQEQAHDLVIEETELKQVVYAFGCSNCTLQIKGKVNSIIVDNCKKFGLVFDNAVGIVEIINSKDVRLQVLGKVPTISINKTEGCHVYLSKDSLDCEIVSAKSSEMNILVPEGEDDYREFPVPEQFKTLWDGSCLVTEPTKIAG